MGHSRFAFKASSDAGTSQEKRGTLFPLQRPTWNFCPAAISRPFQWDSDGDEWRPPLLFSRQKGPHPTPLGSGSSPMWPLGGTVGAQVL